MRATREIANGGGVVRGGATSSNSTPSTQKDYQREERQYLAAGIAALVADRTLGCDGLVVPFPLAEAAIDAELLPYARRGHKYIDTSVARFTGPEELRPHIKVYGLGFGNGAARLSPLNARVDFNPARFAAHGLCPLWEVKAAVLEMLRFLDPLLPSFIPPEARRVSRIDLARDFRLDDPQAFLRAGIGKRAMYARHQSIWAGTDGRLQTLASGAARLNFNLYDKHQQSPSDYTRLYNCRWEAQLEDHTQAKRYGLGEVALLTEENMVNAIPLLWQRSRTATIITRPTYGTILAASDWELDRKRDYLAWLDNEVQVLGLYDDESRRERERRRVALMTLGIQVSRGEVTVHTGGEQLNFLTGVSEPVGYSGAWVVAS